MTQTGLVSIIVPTYNRAEMCKNTVKSALAQTYRMIEVIVVDDGSIDNTRELLDGLDQRVHYFRQENKGVSAARNLGLSQARGDFIAFLDSDDMWLPWKLECQLNVLDYFPSAGMVWTDMNAIDSEGNLMCDSYLERMYSSYAYFNREKHFQKKQQLGGIWDRCPVPMANVQCYAGNIYQWMFMGNLVHTSTVLLRRDRQKSVGCFNEDLLRSGEDYEYHLRTCREGEVAYIDTSSIYYRVGAPDQLTAPEYMIWMARNDLKTVTSALENDVPITLPKNMIRQRLAQCHAWVGMEEFVENRKSARSHFLISLKYILFQKRTLLFYIISFLPKPLLNLALWVKKFLLKNH
jgi:glycosyltransferase involved in cell wall biosynthesis